MHISNSVVGIEPEQRFKTYRRVRSVWLRILEMSRLLVIDHGFWLLVLHTDC